ncbi:UPF0182 family protein [Chloroflexota bacterium]
MDSFNEQWQRWFPEDKKAAPKGGGGWTSARVTLVIAGVILLYTFINIGKGFYTDWLWFQSLGYGSVYTTILFTRLAIFFVAASVFGGLILGNLVLATRMAPKSRGILWPWALVRQIQRLLKLGVILGTLFLSLIFGLVAQANWDIVLRFFHAQPFGMTDPVFQKEVSFYAFTLPFLNFSHGWLMGALIITFFATLGVYLLSYGSQRLKFDYSRPVLAHAGGLVAAIMGLFAWGYWLGIWELVFSERGVVFGASYADIHAKLPAQWILMVAVILCAGIIIYSLFQRKRRWPLYAIGGWFAASVVVGGIFPAVVQRFQVEPSELARERPYIEYNIEYTRQAYALNRIVEQSFPAEDMPTQQDLEQNQATVNNIRLWDPRPLKDTYNQIQAIRLYYDFNDVDIDRYVINGQYRQVMLSARELSAEKLAGQAQTWVNRKLQFTHGYGLALSPVNEVTAEGLPLLMLKDIPPAGVFDIERPQVYFGEKTNDYVFVNTNTQEFDYPMGNENVYGLYQGRDGVALRNLWRRFIYAWEFGDFNILISEELTSESRIMYYRNIQERVKRLAPFLELDDDPYLVTIEGELLWIQDAYTVTDRYPYSEPIQGGINYIRNSVKVVIDAYDGTVTFYVTGPDDALIQTYQSIFPGLFLPDSEMSPSLRAHLRYPEAMFNIQATIYRSYHMRDARVFYNKEDLWEVPREVYSGQEQLMEPYYIIMRLPGEEKEEFLLMLPFTPVNKNNAIGWLAARCDGENYGKLLAYSFPKERLVYGPSQVENRIQQDTVITEQFALWGRGGSRVIRGNLLLIPIGESKLYVEPVFLQAEAGGLPELKRVIVAAGDQIAMEATLQESLAAIYGVALPPVEEPLAPQEPGQPVSADIARLIAEAQQHYDQAQEYLKGNDWAGYGEELQALRSVLEEMADLAGR